MEKEIKFIKEKQEKAYPKEAIRDLFIKKFDKNVLDFEHFWEKAQEIEEEEEDEAETTNELPKPTKSVEDSKKEKGESKIEYLEFPLEATLKEVIAPLNERIKSVWNRWNILAIDVKNDRLILKRYKM